MQLESLHLALLAIPFKTAFKHASAERRVGYSLWVEARDWTGAVGYGEGCPRDYVTGEYLETARLFVARHERDWLASLHDFDSLMTWVEMHRRDIDANPAAWAACELALLDLLGKTRGETVEKLLGLPELIGEFRYTAVLGDAPPEVFDAQLARYRKKGFTDFKIKLSGDFGRDLAKVRSLVCSGIAPSAVRADANNLWTSPAAASAHLEALNFPFRAVEEPLQAGDYAGLRSLSQAIPGRIILDESLLRVEQMEFLACDPERWAVNLRVSKMGGLLRSLDVLRAARRFGIPLVVGAHVGETSVLTRAALPLAQRAAELLLGQEGAYGTHLLQCDVVVMPLIFGREGLLEMERSGVTQSPGFGLTVVPPKVGRA